MDFKSTQQLVLLFFNTTSRKAIFYVWVVEVNDGFDESACGSGTCSIGIASAYQNHTTTTLDVIQPTDEIITSTASYDANTNSIQSSSISGKVKILYDGPLKLI